MSSRDSDCLHRFVFEHTDVRGELVHLDSSWQAVLERQSYPGPLRKLLGEAMAAAALLSATIKFNGSLNMQLQGDGPVSLVLVEVTARRTMRGLAHWAGEVPATGLREQVGSRCVAECLDARRAAGTADQRIAVDASERNRP